MSGPIVDRKVDLKVDPTRPLPPPTVDPWTPRRVNTLTRVRSNPGYPLFNVTEVHRPPSGIDGGWGFLRRAGCGILSRMPLTEAKQKSKTARERALESLRENPQGMSKSELRREVGGNAGAFRRLIQSMLDKGEILVYEEDRPTCGPTKVHKIAS
jgi:hypothetical protein